MAEFKPMVPIRPLTEGPAAGRVGVTVAARTAAAREAGLPILVGGDSHRRVGIARYDLPDAPLNVGVSDTGGPVVIVPPPVRRGRG